MRRTCCATYHVADAVFQAHLYSDIGWFWETLLLFNEVNDTGRSNVSAETPHLVKAARLSLWETAVLCLIMTGRNSERITFILVSRGNLIENLIENDLYTRIPMLFTNKNSNRTASLMKLDNLVEVAGWDTSLAVFDARGQHRKCTDLL